MDIRIVFCNAPDIEVAEAMAKKLVEHRLAACVNILFPCRSVFRWGDTIEKTQEIPMIIKTTASAFDALRNMICDIHPYEVPEILAVQTVDGLPAYCRWLVDNVDDN